MRVFRLFEPSPRARVIALLLAAALMVPTAPGHAPAATLPPGFEESIAVAGLVQPAFTPTTGRFPEMLQPMADEGHSPAVAGMLRCAST